LHESTQAVYVGYVIFLLGKGLTRKSRFWIGFVFIVLVYSAPFAVTLLLQSIWASAVVLAGFLLSVCLLYWFTIKNVKPKYPLVPPEGHPDAYTMARVPRPVYEDMEQYPWLFKKKHKKPTYMTKKEKKKR